MLNNVHIHVELRSLFAPEVIHSVLSSIIKLGTFDRIEYNSMELIIAMSNLN